MHLGAVEGAAVVWKASTVKKPGDEIVVEESEVHSFENTGTAPVDFTFSCPDDHLNEQDRFFTMDYRNGLPPYQK